MQLRDITPAVFRVGQITGADRLYFIWRQALNKVIIFIWGLSRDCLWQVDIIVSKHNKCLAHICDLMFIVRTQTSFFALFFNSHLQFIWNSSSLVCL